MIESLHISNYALIDVIDIDFGSGFNTITGETGAGKSIMLGALSQLMGERADTRVIRDKSRKSVVEATFTVTDYLGLEQYFQANDLEWDAQRCILRRELAPSGRSRAFINDSPVNLAALRGLALQLVDIHSQHQNQMLSTADYQLGVIDNLADNAEQLAAYRQAFDHYRHARRQWMDTREALARDKADADFLKYRYEQLLQLGLLPGEQLQLEEQHELLANMAQIKAALTSSLEALTDGETNTLGLLDNASEHCRQVSEQLREATPLSERLESAAIEIRDITEELQSIDNRLQADPQQLEAVEDRLNSIYEMERLHKVETVEELISIRDRLAQQLQASENGQETLAELRRVAEEARARAVELAQSLSQKRTAAALQFAEELQQTAIPLGMKNLRCQIAVTQGPLSPTGMDNVEFLFAFNKNQPLLPVGGVASGGEISRLMLSIKSLIARKMQLPSIIFDEVDTGVSGDVANRMGQMMADISRTIQVVVITHLPQVAAQGVHHYKVYKEDTEHSTITRVRLLTPEQRIDELALMLSGNPDEPTARATAKTLLERNA